MDSFRELKVWQEAHDLTLRIYNLTKNFPKEERFRLINQLCSSSASVPANIAEGTGRKTLKEYIQFLYNARGSLEETKYHLILAKDLGYLPGGVEEKLSPWMQPLYDNIEYIMGGDSHMVGLYQEQGLLQVEPLTYIRGRSIPKSIILLDEAQNISANEIKTVITRLGEGSKIIITGDIEQIDNPYIDHSDNGLTHVIERFKDHPIAGHVTLQKGERSELATLASQRL